MTNSKDPALLIRLEEAARQGAISRRQFIRYAMLASLSCDRSLVYQGESATKTGRHIPVGYSRRQHVRHP